jgi:putative nucleotidyltransferase-like protein
MTPAPPTPDPFTGIASPIQAVATLSRRHGADGFAFDQSDFHDAAFQKSMMAAAERLCVVGLVLVELARIGRLPEVTTTSGIDAARHLRLARRQATIWDLERDEVCRLMSRAGVSAVLLKGVALRLTAYHDPVQREFADIDVLVPKEAVSGAVTALERRGYVLESHDRIELYLEHHHHLLLTHPRGFVVEVHWALEHGASPYQLDADAVRKSARLVPTTAGTMAAVPAPELMVLHLCHQNLENGFSHLRRLVDVDRVIASAADFDWPVLRLESRRMRVDNVVALSLRLAQLVLGTPIPPGFIESLQLPRTVRFHLALFDPVGLVLEQRGHRHAVQELLKLWCLPTWKNRRAQLREMAAGPETGWEMIVAEPTVGRAARLLALAKLVAYQASLYPAAIVGKRARARRRFWNGERTADR